MSVSTMRSLDLITQELDLADMTKTGITQKVSGKNKIMPISISPEAQSQICLSCMRHTSLASTAIFLKFLFCPGHLNIYYCDVITH